MTPAPYRLTLQAYTAFSQRRIGRTLVAAAIGIWSVVALVMMLQRGLPGLRDAGITLAVAAIFIGLYLFVFVPHWCGINWAEQASLPEERFVEYDDARILFTQESGTLNVKWRDILAWEETPSLLVVYISRQLFVPITKADIGPDMTDAIRTAIIASGLPRPRRRRKGL